MLSMQFGYWRLLVDKPWRTQTLLIRDLLGSPNSPTNDGQRTAKTSWARLARTLPRAAGQYAVGAGPAANAGVAGMLSSKACGNAGHVVKWLKLTYAGHICENHWTNWTIYILFAGDAIRDWIETSRSFAPRCKIWKPHHATVWVATHWSIHLSCPEASGGSWCSGAPLLSRGISITWALLQPVIMPKVTEKESDA